MLKNVDFIQQKWTFLDITTCIFRSYDSRKTTQCLGLYPFVFLVFLSLIVLIFCKLFHEGQICPDPSLIWLVHENKVFDRFIANFTLHIEQWIAMYQWQLLSRSTQPHMFIKTSLKDFTIGKYSSNCFRNFVEINEIRHMY